MKKVFAVALCLVSGGCAAGLTNNSKKEAPPGGRLVLSSDNKPLFEQTADGSIHFFGSKVHAVKSLMSVIDTYASRLRGVTAELNNARNECEKKLDVIRIQLNQEIKVVRQEQREEKEACGKNIDEERRLVAELRDRVGTCRASLPANELTPNNGGK